MTLSNSRLGIALGTALLVAMSGAAAQSSPDSSGKGPNAPDASGHAASEQDPARRQIYIVGYAEPALANYQGEFAGLAKPQRKAGKGRMNVAGSEARAYVADLGRRQAEHEKHAARALGRQIKVQRRMQHAFNGVVTELTPNEAAALESLPEVTLVEPYREYEMDTDTGPRLIGAKNLWNNGSDLPPGQQLPGTPAWAGVRGEGVVFGIIDSGINFGSPSFSGIASDGYRHRNPHGAGNYIGTCAPGGIDEGRCNDKLIGGYDFVCDAPGNTCGVADIREEPGFGDTSGHGSHTASTAAGNPRTVSFRGANVKISGVAPRGNIIAYDVCYTRISTTQGLCPNVSSVAAIDQAVADGVDVINFSIGGGANPWSDAVSQAFLGAANAGVFVAASAGNSGPGAFTLGHVEPWVTTVASAQHGRQGFEFVLGVTGPGTPPPELQQVILTPGSNGVDFNAAIPAATPLVISPEYGTGTDGCAGYPADAFQGSIAVVRRGGCSFSIKTDAAEAAGALAVVIASNAAGPLTPSVPGTAIPAFAVTQAVGDAIGAFASGVSATAGIGYPAVAVANVRDVLAASSSRGPANYELVKPDITAPGVAVLAVDAGETIEGFEDLVGLKSGTSMASPHVAGAAGLLRQLNPSWTPAEIKSALMMTAKQKVLIEDGETAADPFAKGAGRVRAANASRAALVMDEITANYHAANPVAGGDVSDLNIPSLTEQACVDSCTFTRTFRSVRRPNVKWNARLVGMKGVVWPATFKVKGNEEITLTVVVDSRKLPADGSWSFGRLVLEPQSSSPHVAPLRLPVAISVPAPRIEPDPADGLAISLPVGGNGQVQLALGNGGGGSLDWNVDNSGPVTKLVHAATNDGVTSGYRSTRYTDLNTGQFASDDFVIDETTQVNFLSANGFTVNSNVVTATAESVTWAIYPDADGKPAGDPLTSPDTAIWSYTAPPNSPGMGAEGNWLNFDPTVAGEDVTLEPGKYWLLVHVNDTLANRWVWYLSAQATYSVAQSVSQPDLGNTWAAITGDNLGLAFEVSGWAECGAGWLTSTMPTGGSISGGQKRTVRIDVSAAGLAPGEYSSRVCFASNDPTTSLIGVPVKLTVTP